MDKIGIKYCGGCNPKFDRVAFVDRLTEHCGECEVKVVSEGETFDYVVVVCGCSVACACLKGIRTRKGFVIVREDDLPQTISHLKSLQSDGEENCDKKNYV